MSSETNSVEGPERLLEELRLKEARLRDFAEAGSDWFFETDRELRFSYLSDRFQEVTGIPSAQVLGKQREAFAKHNLLASESHLFREISAKMRARKDWKDYTFTFVRDDGERRTLRTSGKAIFDKQGEFVGYRGVGSDLTDQVAAQKRVRSLAQIIDESVNEIYVCDAETYQIRDCNKAAQVGLGYSREALGGLLPWDFVQGLNQDNIEDLVGPLRDGAIDRQVFDAIQVRSDGSTYPVRAQLQFMHTQDPPVFVAVVQDISKQVRAESQSHRFARIVENSLNEIYVFDAETLKFTQANFGARKNMGYSAKEFRELTPVDIKPEITSDQFNELIEPLRKGTEELLVFETVHQRKDGSTYPVEVRLQFVQAADGSVFVAIIQDITERQKRTEELKLRDRAIAEVDTGVLITDARQAGNPIVYANKALERMTGYTAKEMLGRNPRFLQRDDRDQPALGRIRAAIENAVPVSETVRNYRKDGSSYISELSISPVRDEAGEVSHFIGVQSDVTEKLDTEERLRQSQKMEAIGQLTGGIAHDFNNLLTVVLGSGELLADRIADDEVASGLLNDAIAATESGASLTKQLLSFARQMPLQPRCVDLNSLVGDMSDMLGRTLGETVDLQCKFAPDLGPALADPGQTQNALLNLAINARDAMPGGGRLVIETSTVVVSAAMVPEVLGLEPGRYVRLTVSDNGAGMSEYEKSRAMEPFYTTKEPGKGTGLGLSMVHGFAKQSGGHLDIYSELGHGTSVNLYLPVVDTDTEQPADINDEGNVGIVSSQKVLVVEDDFRVRKLTATRLEHLGYEVIAVEDGHAALDALARSDDIDIVFTDLIMPGGINGAELLAQVQDKYPHVKRLMTSGYAEDGAIPSAGTLWLRKPYSLNEMSRVFRQVQSQDEAVE